MSDILQYAIEQVNASICAFCRFITVNDTGENGSHQSGFYIPKCAAPLLFDSPCCKGENRERFVKILWQNSFTTESRFIYYGQKTRNEYRITKFGRGFEFLTDDNVGNLLIIAKHSIDDYSGIVLSKDEDIDSFMAYYNLSSDKTNHLIEVHDRSLQNNILNEEILSFVQKFSSFPDTATMTRYASELYNRCKHVSVKDIIDNPDKLLLDWIDTEYNIFNLLEEQLYRPVYSKPFPNCQELIDFSNQILNRRKSRAGKSLEKHLANIFDVNQLKYDAQPVTEENKKPDFVFPGIEQYHNLLFPVDGLTFLGAKTTCKDRWRQVLNEADRIDNKYLFTLQQGISSNQLKEMKVEKLSLVVPAQFKNSFDKKYHDIIISLKDFVVMVKNKQLNFV